MLSFAALDVLWYREGSRDFLSDLKALVRSLDTYTIMFEIEPVARQQVMIQDGRYDLLDGQSASTFSCPECNATRFDVLQGVHANKPVLGLACTRCNSHGVVFPAGL